jgi:hypothetical protein
MPVMVPNIKVLKGEKSDWILSSFWIFDKMSIRFHSRLDKLLKSQFACDLVILRSSAPLIKGHLASAAIAANPI